MTVLEEIDSRFRAAAADAGLLDVAYDFVDSPIGALFVASSNGGVCLISFDAEPEPHEERLARQYGAKILRSPRAVDDVRRELFEYFEGRRHDFDLPLDLRSLRPFNRVVLTKLAQVPYGQVTTYGTLAARSGKPKAARAVGTIMNRNPVPIVLPCHRVIGSTGSLVGYGGGLARKEQLLKLEGAALP